MALAFKGAGSASTANSATANQASLVLTTATTAGAAGDLAVLCYAVDNAGITDGDESAVTAVTDSGGNKWVKAVEFTNGGTAQGQATCGIWYSNLTATLSIGGTVTMTFHTAANRDASAANLTYFTKGASTYAVLDAKATLANDAAGVGSLNATTNNVECLRIRAIATESTTNTALTKTQEFTAALTQAISTGTMAIRGEYLISTGTGQASAPTLFSGDHASVYAAFKENSFFYGVESSVTASVGASGANNIAGVTLSSPGQIVVCICTNNISVTSVTATGLTFTKRIDYSPAAEQWNNYTVWAAPVTTSFSGTVVVTMPAALYSFATVMAVAGVNTTSGAGSPPFDSNGSLPVSASAPAAGTTSNANDFVFWMGGASAAGVNLTTGAWVQAQSSIGNFHIVGYQFVKATGTYTVSSSGTSGTILDALTIATGGPSGTLATTEAADIAAFAGQAVISAALAATEATDIAAFAGSFVVSGTLTVVEAADAAAFFSGAVSGTLASIELRDVAVFSGILPNVITGTLVANEAGINLSSNTFPENSAVNTLIGVLVVAGIDAADFSSSVTGIAGTLAVTETQDQALFTTSTLTAITGMLATNEAGILLSNNSFPENSVTNTVIGSLAVFGIDTGVFDGFVGVSGALAATEAQDSTAFSGTVFTVITGQLTAAEAIDSAALAGALFNPPAGQLVVTEAQDTAIFNGSVTGIVAQFALIEPSDVAAFSGSAIQLPMTGDLIVFETADVVHFNGVYIGLDDSDFENWKFGQRFDRSLTSRFPVAG